MKHLIKLHGRTMVDVYLTVVSDSATDGLNYANRYYNDSMEDYTDGTVGFDENSLANNDEYLHKEVGVNEIVFDQAEDFGVWPGCHAPDGCHNCDYFDDCQHREV